MFCSESLLLLGTNLYKNMKYTVALNAFERALESAQSEADCPKERQVNIIMQLALCLLELSRLDDALKFARKGQELCPTHFEVYSVLARVHYYRREYCDVVDTANLGLRFLSFVAGGEKLAENLMEFRKNAQHQIDRDMFEPSSSPSSTSSAQLKTLTGATITILLCTPSSTTSTLSGISPIQCPALNSEPLFDNDSSLTITSKKTLRNKKKALRKRATKDKRILTSDIENSENEQSAVDDVDTDHNNNTNDTCRPGPSQEYGRKENERDGIAEEEDINETCPSLNESTRASRLESVRDDTKPVDFIEDCVELAFIRNEKNWQKFVEYTEVFGPIAAQAWAMKNPPVARVLDRLTACLSLRGLRVDWTRAYVSNSGKSRDFDASVKIEPHVPVAGANKRVYKPWDEGSDDEN